MRRKSHAKKFKFRFAVLGDGITEQWYLKHLKDYKGYGYSIRPSLFTDITIEKAESIIDELISGGCDEIIYITDYDTVVEQRKTVAFDKLKWKYHSHKEVIICSNMPCIELWFLLHFRYTTQEFISYNQIEPALKRFIVDYKKKEKYLENDRWFSLMNSDNKLYDAIDNAKKLLQHRCNKEVGKHFPFSEMPIVINEFEKQKHKHH